MDRVLQIKLWDQLSHGLIDETGAGYDSNIYRIPYEPQHNSSMKLHGSSNESDSEKFTFDEVDEIMREVYAFQGIICNF